MADGELPAAEDLTAHVEQMALTEIQAQREHGEHLDLAARQERMDEEVALVKSDDRVLPVPQVRTCTPRP